MQPRALGKTGIMVSPIGLGTVALGRTAGLTLARPAAIPSEADAVRLLSTAHELGVNLIDTAPAYGSSEERLGTLLPAVAPRDRWVIATKAGEEFQPAGDGRSHYDFSPAAISASVDRSLARLRIDAADILLLHFSSKTDDDVVLRRAETLESLKQIKGQGKARAIGASVATAAGGLRAVDLGVDVLMLTLSDADRSMAPVLHAAHSRGIGVLIKKSLAGGRLDPHASLRWVLAQPGVSAAVVGTTSADHLLGNVQAVSAD